jgi:hypothetical protein
VRMAEVAMAKSDDIRYILTTSFQRSRRCDLLQLVASGTTEEVEVWSTDSCYGGADGS